MDKRKSERVQFFQVAAGDDIRPIWVFRGNHAGSVLGLLLDIGMEGVQVLTSKADELAVEFYRLIVYIGDAPGGPGLALDVHHRWSRLEGTLYRRNGLAFDEQTDIQPVLDARDTGTRWFRCEIVAR